MVGKVIAFSSKGGGKNGKHSDVTESSNIAAVSNIALQVFQYRNHGREFRAVTDATVTFQTKQFLIIPSFQSLCLLDAKIPDNTLNGSFIEMPDLDLERFRALKDANEQIVAALKLSRKRKVEGLDLEE
ncbi:hypothetical protein CPB84DRAFT_1969624 [Gymnopilus junonius]|uniref:Uncharacterized protein n=1 Tax=Gymnopilus junonius TaxID=109634 RepID=A0A9P5N8U9_GYMJU|nr:hypothetical protein CPB84DRAFT_1969624 [Gymnopilus junonius]